MQGCVCITPYLSRFNLLEWNFCPCTVWHLWNSDGSNYPRDVTSSIFHKSLPLLLLTSLWDSETGSQRHRRRKQLAWAQQLWLGDAEGELTQPESRALSCAMSCYGTESMSSRLRGGAPCYNLLRPINLWQCGWALFCPLSCSSLLKHTRQQPLGVAVSPRRTRARPYLDI